MEARDDKLARPAFWCGVLSGETRPVAAGVVVRTVRGAYTASHLAEPKKPAEPAPPLSQARSA